MISGFLVKKGFMTSVFTKDGRRVGVTQCTALPLIVTQMKTVKKDGYSSVQVAYGSRKNINNAVKGKLNKIKLDIKPQFFTEFKLTSDKIPEIGSNIPIGDVFKEGDKIDVTGVCKGRGFTGVIKRHRFHKQPILGSSDRVRRPGSIGAQTPGKVIKGKKMPGHFGNVTKTVINLSVFKVDSENNQILVEGPVPGSLKSWVTIKKSK